jgi:hypothetical protein
MGRVKMQPFNVLITETKYDEKDECEIQPDILFGPQLMFAETKRGVVKKAIILSGISAAKIEDVNIYVSELEHISNFGG